MAHDIYSTSVEAEGSDSLREFLVQYQSALKLNNPQKLNNVYNKLTEKDIDYDELLEFENKQLYDTLVEECMLSKLEASRIIKVLKTIQQSTIYKQQSNVTIVPISDKEQQSMDSIRAVTKKVEETMKSVILNIKQLDENAKKCENEINRNLDSIINTVNQRRGQLLSNLKTLKQQKKEKLLAQQNELNSHKRVFNDCHEKCEMMIRDLNIDKQDRKKKILITTNVLLRNKMINTSLNINTSIIIEFKIPKIDRVKKVLLGVGEIKSKDILRAPVIYVKNTTDTTCFIGIAIASNTKLTEYKLEYAECDEDIKSNDDMKLEWKSVSVKVTDNKDLHTNGINKISSLKPLTNYIVRAAVRSKAEWSKYCTNISFKTKQSVIDIFDVHNRGTQHSIHRNIITHTGTNQRDSTSLFTKIITNGHHVWRFKIKTSGPEKWILLGIWKVNSGMNPTDRCFTLKKNGYGYVVNQGYAASQHDMAKCATEYGICCKEEDIVDMYLNMEQLTLKYSVNDVDYGIAFKVEDVGYKAAIGTLWRNDSVEFVKYKYRNISQ